MGVLQLIKQYYNKHAKEFISNTLNVDLKPIYDKFYLYLKSGQKILDIGFGSGRDSLQFYKRGFKVVSIDFAEEIVMRGKILLSNEVLLVDARNMRYQNEFDAIWASAVFLHFKETEILETLKNCEAALKSEGVIYLSFKYGESEIFRHGRYFNDFDEQKFEKMMAKVDGFNVLEMWKTEDARKDHREQYWLNIILQKKY
ncbi:class I SAM-dependent methyltransferase [Fusibacter ferrireducens]|uniref:Class I SAM-dependent methyltransferase n=1 Tax=Fusibacter ferrireducens TaxID=2785058 RepID=A0ABR9ZYS6_9FIRM|nr:class I SAM-dependent methyltransferase [Fusibacter ferrireducens]MBF4695609.1 class I SAM-dependent methyltransferase [Fusibacter ferrireducens]